MEKFAKEKKLIEKISCAQQRLMLYNISNMIVLSGASASGKTEVAKELAKAFGVTKISTTTTRKMRVNEVDGRDYFFVSVERFKQMIEEGLFVEFTHYNNNFYGSTKDQIQDNRCVVIDPSGLKAYMSLNDPRIVTFYLEACEEVRHQRMLLRGDSKEDAEARLINDRITFCKEVSKGVDYCINSEVMSVEEIAKLVFDKYHETLRNRQLEK